MVTNKSIIGSKELRLKSLETRSGIYFLYDNDELVYIGQAVTLTRRIIDHIYEGKKMFNKVRYNLVPISQLNDVETTLIRSLKPKYNISSTGDNPSVLIEPKRSKITLKLVAFTHHAKRDGLINVKIRVCYQRKYFYISTNYYVEEIKVNGTQIIDKQLIEEMEPLLKKYYNEIKYISCLEKFDYVRDKIMSLRI